MTLKCYVYFSNDNFLDYEFYSEGPKGKIRKIVRFNKIFGLQSSVYNLGFGDDSEGTGIIDDSIVTNNEDKDIVLATVANIIVDFSERHGNCYVYAEGSTSTRTRLYQMGIAGLWEEIHLSFDVFGLKEDNWYPFQKNVNYDAFLVKRK